MSQLQDAQVTLTGTVDGRETTLTGAVENVDLQVEVKDDDMFYGHKYLLLPENKTFRLVFRTSADDTMYTIRKKMKEVVHTARVEAAARTAKAVEDARVLIGAPEGAVLDFISDGNRDKIILKQPVMVEFTWTEML